MDEAAYIHNIDPFAFHVFGGFGVRWYGLAYLAGFACAYALMRALSRRSLSPLPVERVGDFVFAVAVGCIAGGRLGYCLFYSPDLLTRFNEKLPFWGVLAIHEGGMASHGGMLGIVLACLYFGYREKVDFRHLLDLVALTAPIGVFFGRIANFVNSELLGRACEGACAFPVKFPQEMLSWPADEQAKLHAIGEIVGNVGVSKETWFAWLARMLSDGNAAAHVHETLGKMVEAIQSGHSKLASELGPYLVARHPSQLYEAFLEGLLLFLLLLFFWRKARKPGVVAGIFLVVYPIVRILGEMYRLPDAHIGYQMFGLTRGQVLSFVMLLVGALCLWCWGRATHEKIGGWKN